MDKRIRRNEICIIGQPKCDYVFSSSRSCFIGYGFDESRLEVDILSQVLTDRGIEPIEAGDRLASGQNAFCTKICSKIITSQFCAIFVNNEETLGGEIPNANVNMEYGLMLGFNKHVIPFQRENQKLPFNVAGLDTVKYSQANFKERAVRAVEEAIKVTSPESAITTFDQIMTTFLISKEVMLTPIENDGERMLFNRATGLGFNLLNDFAGWTFMYFGVFTQLTAKAIYWRMSRLHAVVNGLRTSSELRVCAGFATEQQAQIVGEVLKRIEVWIVISDRSVEHELNKLLTENCYPFKWQFFLDAEIRQEFEDISSGRAFA